MHPIQDLFFLKVFHKYYNLICIFICTPICTKFYSCKKWVLQTSRLVSRLLCEDVSIFLEEFDEREFLFGIQTIAYVSGLGRLLHRQ
jgi:hypothetical protein